MNTPKEEQKHTDLRECPFCKSNAEYGFFPGEGSHEVHCVSGACFAKISGFATKQQVIAAWNTRKADCHEELVAMAHLLAAAKQYVVEVSSCAEDVILLNEIDVAITPFSKGNLNG